MIQQTMTEKNLEAHRRNARHSHGAATAEGKERARAANLRHGYYSQLRDEALTALGEDPEALAELVEGARQQFRPANAYQAWMTDRLARLQWRIDRAERLQESKAAAHVGRIEAKRQETARQMRRDWAPIEGFLATLRRAVARPDFYTPNGCIEQCRDVLPPSSGVQGERIVRLLDPLREPRRFSQPLPAPLPDAMNDAEWQGVLDAELRESSVSVSSAAVAEGAERDSLREQLWNLAGEELRRATEQWQAKIAAQEAPLSPRARDLAVIELDKEMELLRREERSCVREFGRLGNELRKLQKESARGEQQPKKREQPSEGQAAENDEGFENDSPENEGASGYVEENKEDLEYAADLVCAPAAAEDRERNVCATQASQVTRHKAGIDNLGGYYTARAQRVDLLD